MRSALKVNILAVGIILGCAVPPVARAMSKKSSPETSVEDRVWVKKHDGGVSCEDSKTARATEADRKKLIDAGIRVFEGRKQNDGLMRAAVCGIPTGNENAFQIPKADLTKAKALGFDEMP